MERRFFVYILTNQRHTALYTGVTNDLVRRVHEHRTKFAGGFTNRYNIGKLVFYEIFDDPTAAIAREKQIKGGPRRKKVALITEMNADWRDLYETLF